MDLPPWERVVVGEETTKTRKIVHEKGSTRVEEGKREDGEARRAEWTCGIFARDKCAGNESTVNPFWARRQGGARVPCGGRCSAGAPCLRSGKRMWGKRWAN